MREALSIALARHIGTTLTVEAAKQIAQDVMGASQPIDLSKFSPRQCGTLTFAVERFADILPELEVLHRMHWAETEKHRQGIPLNPDLEAAMEDERRGELLQFTVRHGGRLVGNLRVYIRTSRHTQTRFAVEDTIYLVPAHRSGRTAIRLLEFMEDCVRDLGVLELRASTKQVNRTDKLLEFMGWKPVATELVKFLKPKE